MSKPTLLVILGAILLAAAIVLNSLIDWDRNSRETVGGPPPAPQSAPSAASQTEPSASPPSTEAPDAPQSERPAVAPSFDVVRINPSGDAVLAGRAAPGAEVTARDGEAIVGRVQADDRGEWVLVPEEPLPPGSRVFSLSSKSPDGETVKSESELVLVVPERDGGQGALALRVPKAPEDVAGTAPVTVLQSPFMGGPSGGVAIGVIEYDENGKAVVSGRAKPGARLNVYLDDKLLGEVQADRGGEWHLALPTAIAPGDHRLRVDQTAPDGTLAGRSEYDFTRKLAAEDAPPSGAIVVVASGNSLWRIARRTYGQGMRYTLIVEANRAQIRDPDLIYPGQVFELPRDR